MEQLDTIMSLKDQFEADMKSYGSDPTEKLEKAIKQSMSEANKLFDDVLARRDRADATRNALAVMQRYKFLFCMPINIERNIKRGNYDLVINDYARVKNLFKNTEVEVFRKVLEEIDNRISNFKVLLRKKLEEMPFSLEERKKIIRNLVNLDAEGDPAWDAIGIYLRLIYFEINIVNILEKKEKISNFMFQFHMLITWRKVSPTLYANIWTQLGLIARMGAKCPSQ